MVSTCPSLSATAPMMDTVGPASTHGGAVTHYRSSESRRHSNNIAHL